MEEGQRIALGSKNDALSSISRHPHLLFIVKGFSKQCEMRGTAKSLFLCRQTENNL